MNKIKRIFALTGAVLLICMYAATLVFSLIDSPASTDFLKASIAATILIPILLYAFILVAKILKDRNEDPHGDTRSDKQ